jgi:hypothetical protein
MRKTPWLASALILAWSGGAFAQDVAGPDSVPVIGTAMPATPITTPSESCRLAILALRRERQDYVSSFDWSRGVDRVARRHEFAEHMKDFDRRELELKSDWYQATGQADLLTRARESLGRLTQAVDRLPEIGQRPAAAAQVAAQGSHQSPEAVK